MNDQEIQTADQEQGMTSAGITPGNLQKHLDIAEAVAKWHARVRPIAFKTTSDSDWIMIGDTPYLQDSGVNKMCAVLGAQISFKGPVVREVIEDPTGRVDYFYTATGIITVNGRTIEAQGVASTRDKFFCERSKWVKVDGKSDEKVSILLTVDQIDIPSVQKKAGTNMKHRLLDSAFGIKPTVEDLKEYGISPAGGYRFTKGQEGGTTDSVDEKALRSEIRETVLKITAGDLDAAKLCLRELTTFPGKDGKPFPGYDIIDRVAVKMLKGTLTKAKKMLEEQQGPDADA